MMNFDYLWSFSGILLMMVLTIIWIRGKSVPPGILNRVGKIISSKHSIEDKMNGLRSSLIDMSGLWNHVAVTATATIVTGNGCKNCGAKLNGAEVCCETCGKDIKIQKKV